MPARRSSRPARKRDAAQDIDGDSLRARILRAFAERARETGIRGVVMGELAAELGVSKKTLYREFETKESLVDALVEDWVARIRSGAPPEGERRLPTTPERIRRWAEHWTENLGRFSHVFWRELERDYGASFQRFAAVREEGRRRAVGGMVDAMRPGVEPAIALELFRLALGHFNDARVCERLGTTRRDAVLAALEIWMGGALDREEDPPRTARSAARGSSRTPGISRSVRP